MEPENSLPNLKQPATLPILSKIDSLYAPPISLL